MHYYIDDPKIFSKDLVPLPFLFSETIWLNSKLPPFKRFKFMCHTVVGVVVKYNEASKIILGEGFSLRL